MQKNNRDIVSKPVIVFLAVMGICILFFEPNNVTYSLIHKHLKDLFICVLMYLLIKDTGSVKAKMSGLSLMACLTSSFSIRLGCAISSGFEYKAYRMAVNSPEIGNLANSIVFVLLLMIFTTNERR